MIFIRQNKIVVDLFTTQQRDFDLFKPSDAKNFFPDWWKNAQSTFDVDNHWLKQPTIKKCDGIIEYYKHGIMLPMWCDLSIKVQNKQIAWQFSDNKSSARYHDGKQFNAYVSENEYANLKLNSNWMFKSKSNVKFLCEMPSWNYKPNNIWKAMTGVVEPRFTHQINANLLIDVSNDCEFVIEFGSPLMHMIPLTEKNVEYRYHLISDTDYNKMYYTNISFNNGLKKLKSLYNTQSKCPFH